MTNPNHLREQARLLLEIANQMSDARTAERLKSDAAAYLSQAVEIESKQRPPRHFEASVR